MWMMGCNGDNISSSDSYQTRKLFPVIQKPTTNTSSSSYSWLALSNDDKPTSLVGEHRRCDLGSHGSSRWNPTPEQLSILEDVYRRGMRTPTAEQIQHITAKLRRYGKIEGKNVFYWFQNHKARERQRFKRRIEAATEWLDCYLDRRGSDFAGPCGIGFAQCKDMVPTNCSTQTEESILFSREREENLWKNSLAGSDFVFQSVPFQESILFSREREENLWKNSLQFYGDNNITTYQQNPYLIFPENSSLATKSTWEESNREDQDNGEPSTIETLQLFPLHSDAISSSIKNSPTSPRLSHSQHDLIQFFQFLPLKN